MDGESQVIELRRRLHERAPAGLRAWLESGSVWPDVLSAMRRAQRSAGPLDLPELRQKAPLAIGDYGGLAWAVSAYIRRAGGPDVPYEHWTTTWHWPMASFANDKAATMAQVYKSLRERARSSAEHEERLANADPSDVAQLRDLWASKPNVAVRDIAEWSQQKRGKNKLGSPVHVEMLAEGAADAVRRRLTQQRQGWASQMRTALKDVETTVQRYKETTEKVREMRNDFAALEAAMSGFSGAGPEVQAYTRAVELRVAKAREYENLISDAWVDVRGHADAAEIDEGVQRFLAGEGWVGGYLREPERKEVELVARVMRGEVKPEAPRKGAKPIGYVYGAKAGHVDVWPVVSIADARELFGLVKPRYQAADGILLQQKSLDDEIKQTRESLQNTGVEVRDVMLHPTWRSGQSVPGRFMPKGG